MSDDNNLSLLPSRVSSVHNEPRNMMRRIFTLEELDALELPPVYLESVDQICRELVDAARFYFTHPKDKLSFLTVFGDFQLIQESGMIDHYTYLMTRLMERICREELDSLLTQGSSGVLTMVETLWKRIQNLIVFLMEYFFPFPPHKAETFEVKLRNLANKAFSDFVVASDVLRSMIPNEFKEFQLPNLTSTTMILNILDHDTCKYYVSEMERELNETVENLITQGVAPKKVVFIVKEWLQQELKGAKDMGMNKEQLQEFTLILNNLLINVHLTSILVKDNNIDSVLEVIDCEVIYSLYILYSKVDSGMATLMTLISGFMDRKAKQLREKRLQAEKAVLPSLAIRDLLQFKRTIDLIQTECCDGDAKFQSQLQSELQRCFTAVEKFAEFLAIYLDIELRQKKVDNIHQVMGLVHYVSNKDDFERVFKLYLARRLVGASGFNLQVEQEVVELLKTEFGNAYTRRLEKMFADISNSSEFMKEFNNTEEMSIVNNHNKIEFNVSILTPGFWPQMNASPDYSLPESVSQLFSLFQQYYNTKYPSRKMNLAIFNGYAVINATFFGQQHKEPLKDICTEEENTFKWPEQATTSVKTLLLIPAHAIILDLFNKYNYLNDTILDTLGNADTKKGLNILVKNKILFRSTRKNVEGNEEEMFLVNDCFTSKKNFLNLTKDIKNEGGKDKKRQVVTKGPITCRYVIQAAVIRAIKIPQTMTYLEIRDDIVSKMKRQLDESIFKKCLENLIEQGYLKRDEEARDKFHYIP